MKIGSDLDNTIVCYTKAFQIAAKMRGITASGKLSVKRETINRFSELEWTKVQGEVYGKHIEVCKAFPGANQFFDEFKNIQIISHKTRKGIGNQDLRKSATDWLKLNGFLNGHTIQYAETIDQKLKFIEAAKLDIFVDDLPEIFEHAEFPKSTRFFLFDPEEIHTTWKKTERIKSWLELRSVCV